MSALSERKALYPRRVALLLIIPSLALYLFFSIWPIAYSTGIAFTDANELNIAPDPFKVADLENAKKCAIAVGSSGDLRDLALNSLRQTYIYLDSVKESLVELRDSLSAFEQLNPQELIELKNGISSSLAYLRTAPRGIVEAFNCTSIGYPTKEYIIDPALEGNISQAVGFIGERISGKLEEMAFRIIVGGAVSEAEVNALALDVDHALTMVKGIEESIEYAALDFDEFISRTVEKFDAELDRLQMKFIGLSNFNELLHDPRFINSIAKTVLFTIASVPLKVLLGVLLAMLYSSPMIYGRRIWRTMLLIPWAIPILLAGSSWKIMFLPGRGPLSIMTGLDYNNYEWHAFLIYNLFEAWLAYPFVMTVTMGALAGVSKDLIEASYIDGAGAWFRLKKVVFPQIAGPVIFASILTTGASLQAFMVPLLINGGGPTQTISIPWVGSRVGNVNEMMVLFGYNRAYRDKNYGYAAAAYIIVILILMVYIVLWLKFAKSRR